MANLTKSQIQQALDKGVSREQIIKYMQPKTTKKEEPFDFSLAKTISNIPRSGKQFFGGIKEAVSDPLKTVGSLGKIALGGVQKLIPGEQEEEKMFDSLTGFFKQRYGGIENIQRTLQEDPVGFASDLSIVLGGAGGILTKAGQASKVSTLTKVGQVTTKVGRAAEPLSASARLLGGGVKVVTKGKTFGIGKGKIDVPVYTAAKARGVDLPASAISKSRVAPIVESLVGKGFFGQKLTDKIVKAQVKLVQIADDVVAKAGKTDDLSTIGKNIEASLIKYKSVWTKTKNTLYEGVEKLFAHPIKVKADKTIEFLKKVIEEKKLAKKTTPIQTDLKFFQTQLKNVSRTGLKTRELRAAVKEINQRITFGLDPVVTGNKAILRKMVASMSDDLDTAIKFVSPKSAKVIDAVNDFYKQGIEKMNSTYGKKIMQFKNQPDKILPAILNPNTSIDDIPKIFEIIGKKNIPNVRAALLKDLFSKSKNITGDFTAGGITRQLNKYGGKLEKIFTPEQVKALRDIEKIAQGIAKGGKIAEGSQTAFLGRIITELNVLFVNPIIALKLFLGDVALGKFVSSELGQKFLSVGWKTTGKTGEAISRFGEKLRPATGLFQAGRAREESRR